MDLWSFKFWGQHFFGLKPCPWPSSPGLSETFEFRSMVNLCRDFCSQGLGGFRFKERLHIQTSLEHSIRYLGSPGWHMLSWSCS